MKKIPKGKLISINQIREKLAKKHSASIGCPITTVIFARISANAAYEQILEGKKKITLYWRLKSYGEINPKYRGESANDNAICRSIPEGGWTGIICHLFLSIQIFLLRLSGSKGYSRIRRTQRNPKGKKFIVLDYKKNPAKYKFIRITLNFDIHLFV